MGGRKKLGLIFFLVVIVAGFFVLTKNSTEDLGRIHAHKISSSYHYSGAILDDVVRIEETLSGLSSDEREIYTSAFIERLDQDSSADNIYKAMRGYELIIK